MTDDEAYLNAVKETLERLQIPAEDLFSYVAVLRSRYQKCVQALLEIRAAEDGIKPWAIAHRTLLELDIKSEGSVSHETN